MLCFICGQVLQTRKQGEYLPTEFILFALLAPASSLLNSDPLAGYPPVLTANLPSIDFSILVYFKNSSYLKVIMDVQILVFVRIYHNGSQSIATITFNHHRKALTKFTVITLSTASLLVFTHSDVFYGGV